LGIQVYGRGGSRRAGEQAAARLALETAEQLLQKSPSAARKSRPRSAQLKLAGIATDQSELTVQAEEPQSQQKQQHQSGNTPA
jgi:ribonuclease-3